MCSIINMQECNDRELYVISYISIHLSIPITWNPVFENRGASCSNGTRYRQSTRVLFVERQMFEERGADSLRQPSSFMTRKEGSFFFLFLWRRQQEMLSSPPCSVFWFLSPLTFETCYSGSVRQFFLLPTHPQPISTRSGTRQLTRFIPLSGTK